MKEQRDRVIMKLKAKKFHDHALQLAEKSKPFSATTDWSESFKT